MRSARARQELVERYHLVDEAQAQGLGGVEVVAGDAVAVGGFPAGQGGEEDRQWVKPPPITQPCTAAMNGVVRCQSRVDSCLRAG